VFRFGQLYKSNRPDGPMDFFHNTCLVRRQNGLAGFLLFRESEEGNKVRRSANNIFVDVEPISADPAYATAFLPDPEFAGPTDANCYHQLGGPPKSVVRHLRWAGGQAKAYPSLDAYRADTHFVASQDAYPPGFEHQGIDADPRFRSIAPDGSPADDDLRLGDGSPAAAAGIPLTGPPPASSTRSPQPEDHLLTWAATHRARTARSWRSASGDDGSSRSPRTEQGGPQATTSGASGP
jgi:hypothetical protein